MIAPALDYPLVGIVATLLALGLVMVFSASSGQALAFYGLPAHYFFLRQTLWVGVGLIALVAALVFPYRLWLRLAIPVMLVTLGLLLYVLVAGDLLHGARRTLMHGSVQPSEIAKISVIIYVAAWVTTRRDQLARFAEGLLPFGVLMGLVAGLIALEPSFSVTIIVLVTGTVIFFVGGGSAKQLLVIGLIGAAVLGFLIWQSAHGHQRIEEWWLMITDPSQVNEQTQQIMEVLRRHGGIGTRPDNELPKLRVPLLWSDYIFANIAYDLGFVGAVATVALQAALGYRGLGIALKAKDRFGGLIAIGIVTWFLTQAAIHIGASLALIPATGVPLPFVSYGGSSLVACMFGIGLLLNIARTASREDAGSYGGAQSRLGIAAEPTRRAGEQLQRADDADSTTYAASTPVGGRNWGTRLSDPERSERAAGGPRGRDSGRPQNRQSATSSGRAGTPGRGKRQSQLAAQRTAADRRPARGSRQ